MRRWLLCSCGLTTCGSLPSGVAGQDGPRLQAFVTLLTGQYRLSKDNAAALVQDLFGFALSAGQVCSHDAAVGELLDRVVADLRSTVRQHAANIDETGLGPSRWLWVMVTALGTVFQIALGRNREKLLELVGPNYQRVITSDRHSVYGYLPPERHQFCWAHLRRDFQAMVDRKNVGSCSQLGGACKLDGLDPAVCNGVAANVCPGARAMSCIAVEKLCADEGKECDHVYKTCESNLEGCPAPACEKAGELSMPETLATCAAYPSLLDCDEAPDMSHCVSLLTWDGCDITSCQWIECPEQLAAFGDMCPKAMPSACTAVMACDAAEKTGGDGSCCEEFGHVDGKHNTCSVSEGSHSVGCDYEPVLCMTHGCAVKGEADCCLSPDGETVP